jgi:hypothetical protein
MKKETKELFNPNFIVGYDEELKNVTIYTCGACLGNPGQGGCAAVLEFNRSKKVISVGSERQRIIEWK